MASDDLQYEEDKPPGYDENEDSRSQGSTEIISITLAPLSDSNSFQHFEQESTSSGFSYSFVAGEVQTKFATSDHAIRHREKLTISLEGKEIAVRDVAAHQLHTPTALGNSPSEQRDDQEHIEHGFSVKTETLWSSDDELVSRQSVDVRTLQKNAEALRMPAVLRFKISLPDDICTCFHLAMCKLEYRLVVRYSCTSGEGTIPFDTECIQMIHLSQSNLSSIPRARSRQILASYSSPVAGNVYVPRSSFVQGTTIPVFYTIPFAQDDTCPQLRRVTAELIRKLSVGVPARGDSERTEPEITEEGQPRNASEVRTENTSASRHHHAASRDVLASSISYKERLVLLRSGKSLRLPTAARSRHTEDRTALRIMLGLPLPRSGELCESHTMQSPMKWSQLDFSLRMSIETMTGQEISIEKEITVLPAISSAFQELGASALFPTQTDEQHPYWFSPAQEYDGYSQGIPSSTASIYQEEADSLASSDMSVRMHRQATELQQDIVEGNDRLAVDGLAAERPSLHSDGSPPRFASHLSEISNGGTAEEHASQVLGMDNRGATLPHDPLGGPPPYPTLMQYSRSGFQTPYEHDESVQEVLTSAPPYREP